MKTPSFAKPCASLQSLAVDRRVLVKAQMRKILPLSFEKNSRRIDAGQNEKMIPVAQ